MEIRMKLTSRPQHPLQAGRKEEQATKRDQLLNWNAGMNFGELQNISDASKSAVINDELPRLQVDIAIFTKNASSWLRVIEGERLYLLPAGGEFWDHREYRVVFAGTPRQRWSSQVCPHTSIMLSTLWAPNSSSLRILPSLTILANFSSK